jgi:hypothetical protein
MHLRKSILALLSLFYAATLVADPLAAQSVGCDSSQQAAVRCFVANMVSTNIAQPRHGMTVAQFQTYGYAVSQILMSHHTYLVIVGTSSAIADAMPPLNADGSANQNAQDLAVTQAVSAAVSNGLANATSATALQNLQWFSLDVTNAMNDNNGVMAMLTPGVSLRIIDSYIVTGTTNATVNWTVVDASLSTAVDNLIASGLTKLPSTLSAAQLKSFISALARVIYNYKLSTARATL